MGKKRCLNKFISKWIKSDLPEDRTTVLLLGVTRIPTSPPAARRPCSLPLAPNNISPTKTAPVRPTSFSTTRRTIIRRNSSKRCEKRTPASSSEDDNSRVNSGGGCNESGGSSVSVTPSNCVSNDNSFAPMMERSVDSIGTCSLDVEASADASSDWSEVSSVGTLRSASILTPLPEPHLPSYLSLACTVNGYSTTTNYDPIRLARSRDASPHRIESDSLTTPKNTPIYSVQNNLLSPPNLVPLPNNNLAKTMAENTLTHHHLQEFYSSTKSMTFLSKESHFTSNIFSKDSLDGCLENGHTQKCVSFESKNISTVNGQSKCNTEKTVRQEFSNGKETKSFIQQRVERLYGPGALAQGFFVSKRQMNRTFEGNTLKVHSNDDKHSKSMNDDLYDDDNLEPTMRQSTSNPTLPVMRHLRPEFRAQLPMVNSRKGGESSMQKSITVPKLKDEVNAKHEKGSKPVGKENNVKVVPVILQEESGEKNGHYFLKILEDQTKRLLEQADKTESELVTPNLCEETIGKIRSASGKARLLVNQKMQQFKGLCTNNINRSVGEAFPTTNEDLQGFWDMVMLQVHQVDALFEEIKILKSNNWKEIKVDTVDAKSMNGSNKPRKVIKRPTITVNEEARKQREAQRKKMIEDRRKAMKAQQNKHSESIEIFVPESS